MKKKLITIIVILSLLICVLCVKIYFDIQKRNNIKIDDEYQNSNLNPSESDKLDIDLLTNNVFVIDSIEKKDNKFIIFDDYISSTLNLDDTLEEYYEKYKNISCEDISNFVNRLVLDTIYFLKEKDHE